MTQHCPMGETCFLAANLGCHGNPGTQFSVNRGKIEVGNGHPTPITQGRCHFSMRPRSPCHGQFPEDGGDELKQSPRECSAMSWPLGQHHLAVGETEAHRITQSHWFTL